MIGQSVIRPESRITAETEYPGVGFVVQPIRAEPTTRPFRQNGPSAVDCSSPPSIAPGGRAAADMGASGNLAADKQLVFLYTVSNSSVLERRSTEGQFLDHSTCSFFDVRLGNRDSRTRELCRTRYSIWTEARKGLTTRLNYRGRIVSRRTTDAGHPGRKDLGLARS